METYHALTPVAPSDPPTNEVDAHALAPVDPKPDEPEPAEATDQPATIVNQTLEELAREGARRMLERALATEVDEFLGRTRYERRMLAEHGYRNGYGRPRAVAIGTWPVEVRAPRIRDLPDDAPPFHSSILPRRRMLSADTQRLFARLYLEGLSSGDFEPAFRELLGETATLSSSTILRLKDEWAVEYAAWRVRALTARYAYIWADGIYLGAGLEPENSCLLVVVGAREDGRKELLAMELGYRESTESWAGVLRGLKTRGLTAPLLACGDGALGLWAALDEVFPTTRHQRCWNHRVLNVLDKVPKRLWADIRRRATVTTCVNAAALLAISLAWKSGVPSEGLQATEGARRDGNLPRPEPDRTVSAAASWDGPARDHDHVRTEVGRGTRAQPARRAARGDRQPDARGAGPRGRAADA